MPLFIAVTHDNYVESIVLALSKELANAYWQGKGITAYSVRELSEDNIIGHPTGVLPIMSSTMKSIYIEGRHRDFHLVSKG